MGDDLRRVRFEEFSDSGNAVTDRVLQQLSGKPPDPMLLVGKKHAGIVAGSQHIAEITLHVYRFSTEIPLFHKFSHLTSCTSELVVMSNGELEATLLSNRNQIAGLLFVHRKWFLDVNVATGIQTGLRRCEVALGWSCDVNHIRPRAL